MRFYHKNTKSYGHKCSNYSFIKSIILYFGLSDLVSHSLDHDIIFILNTIRVIFNSPNGTNSRRDERAAILWDRFLLL